MHIAHKPPRSLTRISSAAWINACNVIGRWKKVRLCVCLCVSGKARKRHRKNWERVNRKWLRKKCIGNVARMKKKSNGCYKEQMKIVSSAAMRYHSFALCVFLPSWLWLSFVPLLFFVFFYNLAVVSRSLILSFALCLNCHILSLFHFIFPATHSQTSNSSALFTSRRIYVCGVSSSSAAAALSVLAFVLSCGKWMLCHPIDDYMKSGNFC